MADFADYAGVVIGALGFTFGIGQYVTRKNEQAVSAFQGEKEVVAAAASEVDGKKLPHKIPYYSARKRQRLIYSLCLAAVFERSGRSRALLYSALNNTMNSSARYFEEVAEALDRIGSVIHRNSPYTDLWKARHRLFALRAALNLDGVRRIRLLPPDWPSTPGLPAQAIGDQLACSHPGHESRSLVCLTEHLKKTPVANPPIAGVVVCPIRSHLTGLLALDFHRVATSSVTGYSGGRDERFELSYWGRRVVEAKYEGTNLSVARREQPVRELVDALEIIALHNPTYKDADGYSAIPGRQHDLSSQLGRELAARMNRPFYELEWTEWPNLKAKYKVDRGTSIVLVDDVYRTGTSLEGGARLLQENRNTVLGLTATCTVSSDVAVCCDSSTDHHG